jgi:Transposase IS66 family
LLDDTSLATVQFLNDPTKRRLTAFSEISPLALEVVRRIDALFEIERAINGQSVERRKAVRQELSAPLVADLEAWMREHRAGLSRGNDVAKAMDYMLKRWSAFTRFLDDGRICLSNNAAVTRKNLNRSADRIPREVSVNYGEHSL